ncbi:hypothetical protein [Paraflavitalea sp. CAU 1676]|uniref:hypothetical protein n=1 Tax=Paraflavitalea sp. CAU 1676 TaxID=3032598 RepID=UPI0023DA445E|nr:hypothetical protein [Paraflavitalea sp. CAU 1676]MDF2188398.1 hypothetical protein [Paraflavitalea sp. CAU 1676]
MKNLQPCIAACLLLLCTAFSQRLHAQQPDSTKLPNWVKMMDDPKVNYFEAVKAFETYWKDKTKPVEEKEVFSNYTQKKVVTIRKTEREAKEYAFEYKKFLFWQQQTLPYVQPDGSILSTEERLRIFEQEKKDRQRRSGGS